MRHDDPDTYDILADADALTGPPVLDALRALTTLTAQNTNSQCVIDALSPLVTEARWQRIQTVVRGRTFSVVPVLESLSDPHNVSAVLRSADAFGVQRVQAVVGPYGFRASNAVARGSHRWLDIHHHQDPVSCANALRADGYAIYVASMEAELTPEDLCAFPKVAVVFGNERRGVSSEMRALADGSFCVPMRGFVESLNVSVAAALTLYTLTHRKIEEAEDLTVEEQRTLEARYLMNSVRDAEQIMVDYLASAPKDVQT